MYLDLAGLARYKSDFGAWARRSLLPKDAAAARVRTAKAGAVSFVPVQRTPLDVSVDFLFTETPPASGDKGPDNPSTITGVSEVKVTHGNKNYVSLPYHTPSVTRENVTWTINTDGSVTAVGTASPISNFYFTGHETTNLRLVPNRKYFLHGCPSGGSANTFRLVVVCGAGSSYSVAYDYGSGSIFIPKTHDANVIVSAQIFSGYSANLVFNPQLEDGETGTIFEVVPRNVYTLPLGNTYYGGSIDLATGLMTVTWTAVRLGDFQNSLQYNSADNRWEIFVTPKANYSINAICTHSIFKYGSEFTDATDGVFRWAAGNLGQWLWFKSPAATKEAFLAIYGNAYVAFALATPYTVQLTPTEILSLTQSSAYDPRVNTVYGDAQAVQVGYLKHPSAASADLRNAVVSLGGGV